jgi:hypothetical protein
MKIRFGSTLVASAFALCLIAVGCSSTVDEIDNKIDCHSVCKRYADCFNSAYDTDGCEDKCEHNADSDSDRQRKLDACSNCIDDKSCSSATFNCADDCVGIVP